MGNLLLNSLEIRNSSPPHAQQFISWVRRFFAL